VTSKILHDLYTLNTDEELGAPLWILLSSFSSKLVALQAGKKNSEEEIKGSYPLKDIVEELTEAQTGLKMEVEKVCAERREKGEKEDGRRRKREKERRKGKGERDKGGRTRKKAGIWRVGGRGKI
jgi:hypothetical protein